MSGVALLFDDSRGMYIPKAFAESCYWEGISNEDRDVLLIGPTHDEYWDAWESVLNHASWLDDNGNTWKLYQDGALFAICVDIMTEEEKIEFGL